MTKFQIVGTLEEEEEGTQDERLHGSLICSQTVSVH